MGDRLRGLMEGLENKISSKEAVFCENDEEFYFTAGQLAYFILSKSEAKKKNFDMAEPFLRAKGSSEIKKQLNYMFDRYKHAIRLYDTSFKNAMSMVRAYDAKGSYKEYEDIFIAGLMARNMFYKSSENGMEKEEVKKNEDDK